MPSFLPLVGTYSADRVRVLLNGVPVKGFADGDAISIAPQGDRFTTRKGCQGDSVRSRVCDDHYDITISLLPTSQSIAYLESQRLLDEETGQNAGMLSVIDNNSLSVWEFPTAWVRTMPTVTRGADAGNLTYVFEGKGKPLSVGIIPTPKG